jgi:hypothetical protein
MKIKRYYTVMLALALITITGIAAIEPPREFKNLRVLPKNISSAVLSEIMIDEFEDGLGVGCNFCHAENRETHRPDYASDEKPEKQIARAMMRMTLGINKKYFDFKRPVPDQSLPVSCETCHRGVPNPGLQANQ